LVHQVDNPRNPWQTTHVELLGPPPDAALQIYEERAASILSENHSPDLPFRWTLNPYRGCFHACAYCYARPTHQYLDWGAGTDFDRKIVAKVNAPELLREHLSRPSWQGEWIVFSGVTDCYQPSEAVFGLTRSCLEACAEFRNPVGVITKGSLVERDLDVLQQLGDRTEVQVYVSIPFADDEDGRRMEPFASPPSRRFRTLERLHEAGIPTGIALAPLIPGLNDHQIPAILERARAAGAERAFMTLLHLPGEVLPVFEARLQAAFPERSAKVLHALESMRSGNLQENRFGRRMRGTGPRWGIIEKVFALHCRKLGLKADRERSMTKKRDPHRQGELFG
jgi:DNA repair photolyase